MRRAAVSNTTPRSPGVFCESDFLSIGLVRPVSAASRHCCGVASPLHDLVKRLEVGTRFAVGKKGRYLQSRQLFRYCSRHKLIDARAVFCALLFYRLLQGKSGRPLLRQARLASSREDGDSSAPTTHSFMKTPMLRLRNASLPSAHE